jgi:putative acetyltransferase
MTTPRVAVRPEQPADHAAIAQVNRLAFERDSEAELVARIRAGDSFDPALSLVALQRDEVVGHILFSPIHIETSTGDVAALALAPMAVRPRVQRRGIGSRLVRAGLDAAHRSGHKAVIVVGHPNYYPRFGFIPASRFGLSAPFPAPDEAFLALELEPGGLTTAGGVVRYPSAFDGA